jgi:2-polyprenyl-6-hydroxyphenyl methylase/3-demethylubiquinone-9 3-methyltransferase
LTAGVQLAPASEPDLKFEFGKNWTQFLETVTDEHVQHARSALADWLGSDLAGMSFLDIGSGSGLSSLAAQHLGAEVHSFDYDASSVACTATLKQRYFPDDDRWIVERGSVLDEVYLASLGRFDIVYSWGVLHHTGSMWQAIDNAARMVSVGGRLMLAIYNDQGTTSRLWLRLKQHYNTSGRATKRLIEALVWAITWGRSVLHDIVLLKLLRTYRLWKAYSSQRGMSAWHDIVDWAGGFPFEVAKPEEVFEFLRTRGFTLHRIKTCGGGKGCNEFLFKRVADLE